jgi:hypothetical protein
MADGSSLEVVKEKRSMMQVLLPSDLPARIRKTKIFFITLAVGIAGVSRKAGRGVLIGLTFVGMSFVHVAQGAADGCIRLWYRTIGLGRRCGTAVSRSGARGRDAATRFAKGTAVRFGNLRVRTKSLVASAAETLRGLHYVPRKELVRAQSSVSQFETQCLAVIRNIESREVRVRSYLDVARTAHRLGRDTMLALTAALDDLRDVKLIRNEDGSEEKRYALMGYWTRKKERVLLATQLACAIAHLAAISGHDELGREGLYTAQDYAAKVKNVNCRISLAVLLSDVASYLLPFEQSSWLSKAIELATGIGDKSIRLGAVCYVTRKMVQVGIPPETNSHEREFRGLRGPAEGITDKASFQLLTPAVAHSDDEEDDDFGIFAE